jgi:hypothetical protein
MRLQRLLRLCLRKSGRRVQKHLVLCRKHFQFPHVRVLFLRGQLRRRRL